MAAENNGNGKRGEDNPEFKNFQQLLKQVLSVPKEELDKKREQAKKQAR